MKRQFSAGGVVHKDPNLWLIRKPKENPGFKGNLGWSLPKGLIDEGESVETAALRETAEEGGVEAKIVRKLPTLKIFFTDEKGEKVMKFITYFAMEWVKDLPEGFGWETAEVKWVTLPEAEQIMEFASEKQLVRYAEEGR
jgi:8-oxo-dGTP pyrophosphatase MutT (NUDIX family)